MACETERDLFVQAQDALDAAVLARSVAQGQRDNAAAALAETEVALADARVEVEGAAADANTAYDAYIACLLGDSGASTQAISEIRNAFKVVTKSLTK